MSGDDYERQVSLALHDLADEPVPPSPMFDRVAGRVRRRRRHRLTGTTAAVVAVEALAAGGFLLRPDGAPAPLMVDPASCPETNPPMPSDPRRFPDPSGELVPGDPVIATICRYHGYRQLNGALAGTATISGISMTSLAVALNAGEQIPGGARYNCPAYDPGSFRIIFGYRDGDAVTVRTELGYCRISSNGTTGLFTSPQAQQQLTDLLGKDP
jgi:hypothetical protein